MTSLFKLFLKFSASYFYQASPPDFWGKNFLLSTNVYLPALRGFFSRPCLCKPDGKGVNRWWDVFQNNHRSPHLDHPLFHDLIKKESSDCERFSRITITAPGPSSLPLSYQEGVIRLWEIFKIDHPNHLDHPLLHDLIEKILRHFLFDFRHHGSGVVDVDSLLVCQCQRRLEICLLWRRSVHNSINV